VGTLRRECLDHVIVVNERHLRRVLREFVGHYNEARPHQALGLQAPDEQSRTSPAATGRIVSWPVLGGLTHEYEREAA
jgi:transposase InsO family protein